MLPRSASARLDYLVEADYFERKSLYIKYFGESHTRMGKKQYLECLINRLCPSVVPRCNCGAKLIWLSKRKAFSRYCSFQCSVDDLANRNRQWCESQNVENVSQLPRVKRAKVQTCRRNHGVDHPMQSKAVQQRSRRTVQRHYGVDNVSQDPDIQQQKRQTMLLRYGYEEANHSPEIKERIRQVFQDRYGVDHPMHVESIFKRMMRNRFLIKKMRIKGITYEYMGYEGIVIKGLLQKGFRVTTKVPKVLYRRRNRDRQYTPDILAQKEDRRYLIEVKSTWTLGVNNAKFFRANKAKFKAAAKLKDVEFILILVTHKGSLVFFNPETLTLRELRRSLRKKNVSW